MEIISTVARTNNLYCSECCDPVKRGEEVLMVLDKRKMDSCFCLKCSDELQDEKDYEDALEDAIGIGQD